MELVVFDDGSDDPRIEEHLSRLRCEVNKNNSSRERSVRECASRIGDQRRKAIDFFLSTDYPYVFLMDDDILTTCDTIREAIEDFEFLRSTDYGNPGALTLHHLLTRTFPILTVRGREFTTIPITGEANLLMHRDALQEVGNRFGSEDKGFGDRQLWALRSRGYIYWSRIHPTYEVQHIGFGSQASIVHATQSKPPSWVNKPYHSHWGPDRGKMLGVRGFSMALYCRLVEEKGGMEAPLYYVQEKSILVRGAS